MRHIATLTVLLAATVGMASAQADHRYRHHHHRGDGDQWAYLLGGAVLGAALGGIVYDNKYGDHYGYSNVHYYPRYRGYRSPYYRGYGHRYYKPRYRRHKHYYDGYRRHYDRHYAPRRHYRRYRH